MPCTPTRWRPVRDGLLPLLALALVLAACRRGNESLAGRAASRAAPAPATAPAADSTGAGPAEAPAPHRPAEIYYDLSTFDWYREGRPIARAGFAFRPAGPPVRLAVDSLREAGRFEGVTYYVRVGGEAAPDTLYVPVFEGYWEPFARGGVVGS